MTKCAAAVAVVVTLLGSRPAAAQAIEVIDAATARALRAGTTSAMYSCTCPQDARRRIAATCVLGLLERFNERRTRASVEAYAEVGLDFAP